MNKTSLIIVLLLVVVGIGALLYFYPIWQTGFEKTYSSDEYGLSFDYSQAYFIAFEETFNGEREQHVIVLAPDTEDVRELFSSPQPSTESPPTITITIFQNNLDNYTLRSFVEGTNFSNFKLSDGKVDEITLDNEPAWHYRATGLYENENIVVVLPEYVYMFTVFFNSPDDEIRKDFEAMLKTVTFTDPGEGENISTSADNAPPGSIHNLPVPKAVAAVKAHVAEKSGVEEGLVIMLSAYERDWSDSCLGLGGASESCLFAITPGYEVTVQVDGKEQTFRTNMDGLEIRREK